MPQPRYVVLDRDGTLIVERNYLADPAELELLVGVGSGLRRLKSCGLRLIIVTNQSAVGRGRLTHEQLHAIHARLRDMLSAEGISIEGIYYCPHTPDDGCDCRKPRPGLLMQAACEHTFDPRDSFVIGDKLSDIELGRRAGAISILVRTGYGAEFAARGPTGADFCSRA